MDVERIIDDIEQLQEMFEAPDIRPLTPSDICAANRRHDEMLADSPWFQLWKRDGLVCRTEPRVQRWDTDGARVPTRVPSASIRGVRQLTLPRVDVKNGEEEGCQCPA